MKIALPVVLILFLVSCKVSINEVIRIADNTTVSKNLSTVNGNVYIGSDCRVDAKINTVNGSVEINDNCQVSGPVKTINGKIIVGSNCSVADDLKTINGNIEANKGSVFGGNIATINGDIVLQGVSVKKNLHSYYGDITLLNNSLIKGDIIIEDGEDHSEKIKNLSILIDSSAVEGNIEVLEKDIRVSVKAVNGGKVSGKIIGAVYTEE